VAICPNHSNFHRCSFNLSPTDLFHLFEATRNAGRAARGDRVAGRVQNLKGNLISERIPVNTNLDGAREPVCLYPDPGRAKNEGVGDRTVIVVLGMPPDPQTGGG
jgi:hypothetical protein